MVVVDPERGREYREAWEAWQRQLGRLHEVFLEGASIGPPQLKGLLNREARAKERYDAAREALLGLGSAEGRLGGGDRAGGSGRLGGGAGDRRGGGDRLGAGERLGEGAGDRLGGGERLGGGGGDRASGGGRGGGGVGRPGGGDLESG